MDSTDREGGKKQILLRVSASLWKELAAWAEDDFRSINGQIEYLLTESVKKRRKAGAVGSGAPGAPEDVAATAAEHD